MILIVGIIISLAVGYSYFLLTLRQGSWHQVKNFILATENGAPGYFEITHSYPNMHISNDDPQTFTIKEKFWRVTVETLPYFSYTVGNVTSVVYYNGAPMNTIQIWKDLAFANNPIGSITLLDPYYEYNATAGYNTDLGLDFYAAVSNPYVPVRTAQILSGAGNYAITLEMKVCCFNFTIEEYG